MGCVSCSTVKNLPPVDFSAPGWGVRSGQAVWKPAADRAELTGDLVLATNASGDFFVQLLKTPFPLVTAQEVQGSWQIEFGANEHHWQGHGTPPARFVWFQLPVALAGGSPGSHWQLEVAREGSFKLENRSTGESLEGVFFP
jgi:hypothetical protein